MLTDDNPFKEATCYNACVIKSVHFGCGIAELNDQQEKKLRRTCEEPLLVELGLSRKFPRNVLHSRKSALGVGIMTPRTMIDTLKENLHLGNIKKQGVTSNTIDAKKEHLQVGTGRDMQIGNDSSERHCNRTWIDEIIGLLFARRIEIKHNGKDLKKISQNKTIMVNALQCAEQTHQNRNILKQMNFVKLKKIIFLPCELVENNGRSPTDFHRDIEMSSQIE